MKETVPGTKIQKPVVTLTGYDGNAFAIIGRVTRALKAARVPKNIIDEFSDLTGKGDYNDLLQLCEKYVDVE